VSPEALVSAPALDRLTEALSRAIAGDGRARVLELLEGYARAHEDWRAFAFFDPVEYTRNEVARERDFELLLLCWGPGQESPIHNHEGQDCWMAVLEGEIEEVRFPRPEEVRPGPLEPVGARTFGRGEVAFIRDEIGLHLVRPARPGTRGVSLHLYAAPYEECDIYCPRTGRVTRKRLSSYSVRGRRVAPSRA
jgi:cysteine dioxygenase